MLASREASVRSMPLTSSRSLLSLRERRLGSLATKDDLALHLLGGLGVLLHPLEERLKVRLPLLAHGQRIAYRAEVGAAAVGNRQIVGCGRRLAVRFTEVGLHDLVAEIRVALGLALALHFAGPAAFRLAVQVAAAFAARIADVVVVASRLERAIGDAIGDGRAEPSGGTAAVGLAGLCGNRRCTQQSTGEQHQDRQCATHQSVPLSQASDTGSHHVAIASFPS